MDKISIQEPKSYELGFYTINLKTDELWLDQKASSFFDFTGPLTISTKEFMDLCTTYNFKPLLNEIAKTHQTQQSFTTILTGRHSKLYMYGLFSSDNPEISSIQGFIHPVDELLLIDQEPIERSLILSNMTHEIRTPLNAIKGYAELLGETKLNSDQQSYLNHIQETSKHLSKIVNDILDYSKLEAGKMQIDPRQFKLEKLLDDVHIMLKEQIKQKQLYLDVMNIDCPKTVIGDSYRIRQILINFVSNAAKFTEIGGISLSCNVDHAIDSNHVMVNFKVKDTGIGISKEELPRVFQAFDQANATTSRLYGGTGLGLHISLKIAHLMHGDISLESKVNEGSTFVLSLPLEYQPLMDTNESVIEKKPRKDSNILLVEDNPLNQKLSERILSNLGMNVSIAKHGMEAVKAFQEKSFHLVFMDIHMPIMDGYEATRIIRKHNQEIPIIAMSSDALYDDQQTYISAGMSDVIEKPVDPLSILTILSKWIPED